MKNMKILIVDDNKDYAEGMADLLESRGYTSSIANSGLEALDLIKEDDFDLTFMDVRMPGMNGVEAYKAILEINPKAKVVMMTAYSVESLLEEAMLSGVQGVLHKPLNMDEVFEMMEDMRNRIILLVDDDPDFTEGVEEILRSKGYEVEAAVTGDEAIRRITENGIDMMLIDLRIPELDGLEVIRRLDELGQHIPTVILTGFFDEEKERLREFSSPLLSGVLAKPFAPDDLLNLVNQIDFGAKP